MALVKRQDIHGPGRQGGPSNSRNLSYARGNGLLNAAGTFTINVLGFVAGSQVFATFGLEAPGTGALNTSYNSATGLITVTSSAGAADSGALVNWVLVD